MSKRGILNLTSTKKRDELAYYNPDSISSKALTITSSGDIFSTNVFLFCPTGREQTGTNESTDRNSSSPFYRGYAETMSFWANNSVAWRWRRIVFATRSLRPNGTVTFTAPLGYTRVMVPYGDSNTFAILFKGTSPADFTDLMDAKVDNNRAKVMYDKTRILRSGSASHAHKFKLWHAMNKTVYYDEDENAASESSSPWSTTGSRGMGDVFIMDMFSCASASTDNTLTVKPQGTIYWHEK